MQLHCFLLAYAAVEVPEPIKQSAKNKRRLALWLSVLVCAWVFNGPLLRGLVRTVAPTLAALAHVQLSFELDGSVLRDIELRNFSAKALRPAPLQSFTFKSAKVSYSLRRLFLNGPQSFIRTCEIQDMELVLDPKAEDPRKKKPMRLSGLLRDIAHPPTLPTERGVLKNFRLISHMPEGDFELLGASALLDQKSPGYISIQRLHIPKVHTWENFSGPVTFENGTVTLRDVALDNDVRIDWARIAAPKNGATSLTAEGQTFGGKTRVTLEMVRRSKQQYTARIHGRSTGASLDAVTRYFHGAAPGGIKDLVLDVQGDPDDPRTWTGFAKTEIDGLQLGNLALGLTRSELELKEKNLKWNSDALNGPNKVVLQARMDLPERLAQFRTNPIKGTSTLEAGDLALLLPHLSGNLSASGNLSLKDSVFGGDIQARTTQFAASAFSTGTTQATFGFAKTLQKGPPRSFFEGLNTTITAQLKETRIKDYAADTGELKLSSNGPQVRVEKLALKRSDNTLRISGESTLPQALGKLSAYAFDTQFSLSAPNLAACRAEPDLTALGGKLDATGHLVFRNNVLGGRLQIDGTDLSWEGFVAKKALVDVTGAENLFRIQKADLVVDQNNRAHLSGSIAFGKPLGYSLSLLGDLKDLSVFAPLLQAFGHDEALSGAASVHWEGSAAPGAYSGKVDFNVNSFKLGNLVISEASTSGTYTPESAEFPQVRVVSDKTSMVAALDVFEGKLRLRNLELKQAGTQVLSGFAMIPFEPKHFGTSMPLFPQDAGIAANVNASDLDMGKLFASFGKKAPLDGIFSARLVAGGSLGSPSATLKVSGRGIKSEQAARLDAGALEAQLHYAAKELSLDAMVRQPEVQSLRLQGRVPLDLNHTLQTGALDPQTPLEFELSLPTSRVAFLSKLIPSIRFIDGSVSGAVGVKGTVANPALSGALRVNVPAIRFNNPETPAFNDLVGDLRFADNRLSVNRLSANLGGGAVSASGNVLFPTLTAPLLDLSIKSDSALLVRNDTLTLRADSSLKIEGPFAKAAITGKVGITKSRFFREVDLLPIQLPGRPAPRSQVQNPGFSIKQAPFRDWTFDVRIKTKDPFAVRGNLTNGSLQADLKLIGTGLTPTLDGSLRLEEISASLPFSRLDVASGYVYFKPESPFVPSLDIQGTSQLRNYNISVYIYGTASQPTTVFSSEPPLPQDEIIALLATGSTSEELTSNPNAVAGRAAALLFQKVYRKVFKSSPEAAAEKQSIASRFQLDVGGVDPQTGLQEVQASFKMNNRFYLVGDLNVQGNARGQVRYLLHFR